MPKLPIPRRGPQARLIEIFPETQPLRVKYKDAFDLKAFYEALHEWLMEHEWEDQEGDSDHWESYYGERVDPTKGKEIWIQWRVKKKAPGTSQLTFYLDFDWHCLGLTKISIVKEGTKMNVDKGELDLYIRAYIEEDYKKSFGKNKILQIFKEIFARRVYREILEQRKKELYQEAYELQNWIKQWFKLKRYLPYEETKVFFSSQAWPSHLKEE